MTNLPMITVMRLARSAFMDGITTEDPGNTEARKKLWRQSYSRIQLKQLREEMEER